MIRDAARRDAPRTLSLRLQVICVIALALSPLLMLGGMLALGELGEARQDNYQQLVGKANETAAGTNAALAGTRLALRMMAADARDLSCPEIGSKLSDLQISFRNVLRFNAEGEVACFISGESLAGQPMPGLDWNDQLRKGVMAIESSAFRGLALGEPVIWMLKGVKSETGEFKGSVAVTVSIPELAKVLPAPGASPGLSQALVLMDGKVISSGIIKRVPAEWLTVEALLERKERQVRLDQGGRVDVVLMPLAAEGLWLLTPSEARQTSRIETVVALTIPILVFLAALFTATWIMDTLVLRWVERLRLRITDQRHSAEYITIAEDLARAPYELQQLARAFDELTKRVTKHESDLLEALAGMKAAVRETHHRVKNNLQVMLSMLKLQVRIEPLPETQHALRIAAQRISMMAAVHHSLLNEAHVDTVDAPELFDAICTQIDERQGWEDESRRLVQDVEDVPLPSDIAVPMAMFVQEAFDHLCPAARGGFVGDLGLEFRYVNGQARLRVSCGRASAAQDEATQVRDTNPFLAAFARQLGGVMDDICDNTSEVTIELNFPIKD